MDEIRTSTSILGLTHDPFKEPEEAFFEGGDRTRQLEELRHLSRWSRRLLVVTGEKGLGKSTLCRALSSRLDPGVKAARVKGTLLNNVRDVLVAIVQGFGLAAPVNANLQVLSTLICDDVAAQSTAGRYCLVLIDDAHLLEPRAVVQLLELVRYQPLRIVFFAEPQFVQTLQKELSLGEQALNWHEIRLARFGSEEIKRYLKLRLREAGGKGDLPFTTKQTTEIITQSQGIPGKINDLASERLRAQAHAVTQRPASRLPDVHRSVAYLVIVLTALVWLVWERSQEPAEDAGLQFESMPGAVPREQQIVKSEGQPTPEQGMIERRTEPQSELVAETPLPQQVPMATNDVTVLETSTETENPIETTSSPGVDEATQVSQQAASARAVSETTSAEIDAVPVAEVSNVVSTDTIETAGYERWILDQPPSNYTLQLFGTSNRTKWQQFMRRQEKHPEIASFKSRRNGQDWFVVLFGSYPDRASAGEAAASLPSSVGKLSPWIRTFSGVQDGIRAEE